MANTNVWDLINKVIPQSRVTLLYGKPGTGKSFAAHNADLSGRQLFSVTMTPETPAAELRGHYVPQGSQFVWQDGAAIKAWRFGGRWVINEIDHAGGDALSFLLNCLDSAETACLTLPTGELVKPHPQFQAVATMNGSPDDLPSALRDRFPVCIEVDAVHPSAVESLPSDLRNAALGSALADSDRRVSIRAWQCFASLRASIGDAAAAQAIFAQRAKDVLDSLKLAGVQV
jgi:MoxR-like ATPase